MKGKEIKNCLASILQYLPPVPVEISSEEERANLCDPLENIQQRVYQTPPEGGILIDELLNQMFLPKLYLEGTQ